MNIHHVGYLTKTIAKTREAFLYLGYEEEREVRYDDIRMINIAFLKKDGYRIELIEPFSKESPMFPLLKHYKNTPYHICYSVTDLEDSIAELEKKRYHVIDPPEKAPCLNNRRVAFLMHKDMGIIELLEEGN